jgi:TetR/AcrR family transcriptional repressor of nem operon
MPGRRRVREPDVTRDKLLNAAFEEIHLRGFQGASVDSILTRAGVTKGALYHHFPDKASLGFAVLDEVLRDRMVQRWAKPNGSDDPITALQDVLRERAAEITPETVELGCPLNNIAQEMSPLDERFRRRINTMFDEWIDGFSAALERGQAQGIVRRDIDPRKVACFILASVEGSYGIAKGAKSTRIFRSNLEVLAGFLETLRVP